MIHKQLNITHCIYPTAQSVATNQTYLRVIPFAQTLPCHAWRSQPAYRTSQSSSTDATHHLTGLCKRGQRFDGLHFSSNSHCLFLMQHRIVNARQRFVGFIPRLIPCLVPEFVDKSASQVRHFYKPIQFMQYTVRMSSTIPIPYPSLRCTALGILALQQGVCWLPVTR